MNAAPALYEMFDRVVCINLDRRPDRWNAFRTRLSTINWPFREVERYRAIDGKRVKSPSWFRGGSGAWGCLQSHLRLLEDTLQNGTKSLLILEDDATFPVDFGSKVEAFLSQLPSNWDALMLGGQHLVRPYFVSGGIVRVANGNRTHAHAMRGRYLQAAYQHLCDYPTHIRVPSHHVDHRLGSLHISGKYCVYAPNPWLVGQANGASDISGKQEKERFWMDARQPRTDTAVKTSNVQPQVKQRPLIMVVGLYRSGCRIVAEILQNLGIPIGSNVSSHLEDEELKELLCNFFSEPQLAELVARPQREKLLRAWLSRFNSTAPLSAHYLAVKHPLLPLVGYELASLTGKQLRVIQVDRDFDDAVHSLEKMPWDCFKKRSRDAQMRLRAHLDDFLGQFDHLRIEYEQLTKDPGLCAANIAAYLQLDAADAEITTP